MKTLLPYAAVSLLVSWALWSDPTLLYRDLCDSCPYWYCAVAGCW